MEELNELCRNVAISKHVVHFYSVKQTNKSFIVLYSFKFICLSSSHEADCSEYQKTRTLNIQHFVSIKEMKVKNE